jgi:HSP20 family protein
MLNIRLPDTVDDAKIEAKFDKGVVKVTAAKKPEAVKVKARSNQEVVGSR